MQGNWYNITKVTHSANTGADRTIRFWQTGLPRASTTTGRPTRTDSGRRYGPGNVTNQWSPLELLISRQLYVHFAVYWLNRIIVALPGVTYNVGRVERVVLTWTFDCMKKYGYLSLSRFVLINLAVCVSLSEHIGSFIYYRDLHGKNVTALMAWWFCDVLKVWWGCEGTDGLMRLWQYNDLMRMWR